MDALDRAASANTIVYFAFQLRSVRGETMLFGALSNYFTWEKLKESEYHPDFQVPTKITIYKMKKKSGRGVKVALGKAESSVAPATTVGDGGHADL